MGEIHNCAFGIPVQISVAILDVMLVEITYLMQWEFRVISFSLCSLVFLFPISDRSEERRVGKSVDLGGRRIIKKKKKNKIKMIK